jgi:alginate O-acetyltransferase complex protein AlgI
MLLGGLWHGASWNFVLWGGLHGVGLVLHKALEAPFARAVAAAGRRLPWAGIAWAFTAWCLTQFFVLLCWVPFRAANFTDTVAVLSAFAGLRHDQGLTHAAAPYALLLIPVLIDTFFVSERIRLPRIEFRRTEWFYALAGAILAILLTMVSLELKSFIYFQF